MSEPDHWRRGRERRAYIMHAMIRSKKKAALRRGSAGRSHWTSGAENGPHRLWNPMLFGLIGGVSLSCSAGP
jgi:hypothetical protein